MRLRLSLDEGQGKGISYHSYVVLNDPEEGSMIDISRKNRDGSPWCQGERRRGRSLETIVVVWLGNPSTYRLWKGLELGGRADETRLDLLAQLGLVPKKQGMSKCLY